MRSGEPDFVNQLFVKSLDLRLFQKAQDSRSNLITCSMLSYDFALEIRVSCVNVAKENDSHEPRVLTDGRFRIVDASFSGVWKDQPDPKSPGT